MRVLRRSKTWVFLSLFAMLGVVITPALAFNCCCTSVSGSLPGHHAQTNAQPTQVASDQSACHGRIVQPVVQEEAKHCHPAQSTASPPDEASKSGKASLASVDRTCDCPQAESPAATTTDNASGFSSLCSLAFLPTAHGKAATHRTQRLWFLADGAHGPRGPSLSTRCGRAPPVI